MYVYLRMFQEGMLCMCTCVHSKYLNVNTFVHIIHQYTHMRMKLSLHQCNALVCVKNMKKYADIKKIKEWKRNKPKPMPSAGCFVCHNSMCKHPARDLPKSNNIPRNSCKMMNNVWRPNHIYRREMISFRKQTSLLDCLMQFYQLAHLSQLALKGK